MRSDGRTLSVGRIREAAPSWLWPLLAAVHAELGGELYLAGGVVRDLLLGQRPADIDLTVATSAMAWAQRLAGFCGGTLVPLGRQEDAARVASRGVIIDFASFREGAQTIVEDLARRDLTINAMACRIDHLLVDPPADRTVVALIDPTGGLHDLATGLIRPAGRESFVSDPLRLVRVFRFAAALGGTVEPATLALVERHVSLVRTVAPERIAHELDILMATTEAAAVVELMAGCGLLWAIIPELRAGVGMAQPKSHHLDVWCHNLETLRQMESLLADPDRFFSGTGEAMAAYLDGPHRPVRLKWAALLHDLGKPATHGVRPDRGGRITFYNHDREGARLFDHLATRLRWSNEAREQVGRLIAGHMRPFHLANVARNGSLTLRAAIRMIRAAGTDLPGLFLLALADSLAGQGVERIEDMERELVRLYGHLDQVRVAHVEPVRSAPPLLTGRDLIEQLRLTPGPLFKRILTAVEEARMAGEVGNVEEALRLAGRMAAGEAVDIGKQRNGR